MLTCDCCQAVVRPNDSEAVSLSYNHRAITLCRECARIVVALVSDMRLSPPLAVIR